jgi:hypothetical protein
MLVCYTAYHSFSKGVPQVLLGVLQNFVCYNSADERMFINNFV